MSDLHVFISYSRHDKEFVEKFTHDLQAAGIKVWIDKQGLKVGTPDWEQVIREAIRDAYLVILVASPDSRESRYVRDELIIAEMYKCGIVAVWASGEHWPESIRMGLMGTQFADARGKNYKTALLETIAALNNLITTPASKPSAAPPEPDFEPRNPYKGLRAFTGKDKGDFFGRGKLITELVEALKENVDMSRFLAIVGSSGSGKSSVVMAGLLPRLQEGSLPGSDNWIYLDPVLPGAQPLESLAVILADALKMPTSDIQKDLDASSRGLHLLSRRLAKQRDKRVVLLVDQFEELFTQTTDADQRNHFIDLLVTAATEPAGQTIVLITLRADFYDRPMYYPELGKLLEKQAKSVFPMDVEDLRGVMEKPTALPDVGLQFEGGLVGDLLFEVRGQIGALPLLKFTLNQLVERREGKTLTHRAYKEIGGIKGALAKHAEFTFEQLPSINHKDLTRPLFLRLIEPGATEQDTTRRRANQNEFITSDDEKNQTLQQIIDVFTKARLLTANKIAGISTLEISHEALIREWARLAEWMHIAREDIQVQQRLSSDAHQWIKSGKPNDDLYRGTKLKNAIDWSSRNTPSAIEMAFIVAASNSEQRLGTNNRIKEVEEIARKQLARDLHDDPTQDIAAIAMRMTLIRKLLESAPDEVPAELKKVEDLALKTIKEIRSMLFTLRPLVIENEGLSSALIQFAEKIALFDQRMTLKIDTNVVKLLDTHQQGVLLYIIEEAVLNARKHAEASLIQVSISHQIDSFLISISDNGIGFDAKAATENTKTRGGHLGMINLYERAEMINAKLQIISEIGIGTNITVEVRISQNAHQTTQGHSQMPFAVIKEFDNWDELTNAPATASYDLLMDDNDDFKFDDSESGLDFEAEPITSNSELLSNVDVDSIVRNGIDSFLAGRKEEARALLLRSIEIDQYNELAWLLLSATDITPDEQRICLNNVLTINPNNERAKRGIQYLDIPPKTEEERKTYYEWLNSLYIGNISPLTTANDDADDLFQTGPFSTS